MGGLTYGHDRTCGISQDLCKIWDGRTYVTSSSDNAGRPVQQIENRRSVVEMNNYLHLGVIFSSTIHHPYIGEYLVSRHYLVKVWLEQGAFNPIRGIKRYNVQRELSVTL